MAINPYEQQPQQEQPQQTTTGLPFEPWGLRPSGPPEQSGGWTPAIDVVDNSDELWVFADVPGFTEDELRIRGDETTLLISAERIAEVEEGRNVLVHERPSRVERTVQLPAAVSVDEANVTYEAGVCKITLPKAATERFTEIKVESD